MTAQGASLFFVLVGLFFVGSGRGPDSSLNAPNHETMVVAVVLGLALLLVPVVNGPLRS